MTTKEPSALAVELANLLGHGKGNPDILDCKTCEWHDVAGLIQSAIDKATEDLRADADKLRDALELITEDLNCEITSRFGGLQDRYPGEKRRYDRDMQTVLDAKDALASYNAKYGEKK